MSLLNPLKKSTAASRRKNQATDSTASANTQMAPVATAGSQKSHGIIIRPLMTEKATQLAAQRQYVFSVNPKSNKIEIVKAIRSLYNVSPVGISIIQVRGKRVQRGRVSGVTKAWKKAVVTLPVGQTINLYQGA